MWAVVGEGLGILPCANEAGGRLAGVDVRSEPVGSVSGPRNDGSELFRGSPGDQRGPDGRSPRTSIAGSGSIGMRSYLRPLGAVSVTCRAPLSSRQRYRTGRESS